MLPALLLLAAAGGAGQPVTQVIVRSHVVVRVQAVTVPVRPLATLFHERKGPRCVALVGLAGAAVIVANSVDLVLRDGGRVRARFAASCPALDYYSGFYLVPNADGMMCAGRDVVRDRAGGECPIDRIRALELRK